MNLMERLCGRPRAVAPIDTAKLDTRYEDLRQHVLTTVRNGEPGTAPFRHCYLERIFPDWFYDALIARKAEYLASRRIQARTQDSADFVNRRYPLATARDTELRMFRALFEDAEVKTALLSKFFIDAGPELAEHVDIHHDEFEFVFCRPGLFQNIHVDIPPKYLSIVFYFPSGELTDEEEDQNATLLYDEALKPVYGTKFRPNSVCVFAPHFHSYHGFSTSVPRDVIVMFLINRDDTRRWGTLRSGGGDAAPDFSAVIEMTAEKLARFPLIEYGRDPDRIAAARASTRVNAPRGRVMVD